MPLRATLTIILTLAASTAFAQSGEEKYSGRPIADVRLFIEQQPTTDAALVELVETRVGRPLTMAAVRESITHLYSLGRFQDVQVEAADAPDGAVSVTYKLVPLRVVERVRFQGELGLSEGVLRNTVEERFGRTPQLSRAAEAGRTLERLYADRGYFRASVRPVSSEVENSQRTLLTFEIHAGPRAHIGAIDVAGDAQVPREALLPQLRIAAGLPYDRVSIEDRLAEYTRRLKSRGHLQASASHTPRVSEDGTTVDLTLDVHAGPIVTVTFQGDPVPRERRDELVPFQREGSVDQDLIEDSTRRITDYLRQQGYWKADVREEQQSTDKQLTIVFTIRKGPLYRVAPEGLEVNGNRAIPIEEIRPLIVLTPGAPYISSYLDASVSGVLRLYRTRGFASAQVQPGENEVGVGTSTGAALVRPTITITEGPRMVVGDIHFAGTQALREEDVRRVVKLQAGAPFYEPTVRADRDAIELEYRDLGFSSVQATVTTRPSEDRTRVDLTFTINEGPQTIVDHVIIVGNRRTREDVVRREVVLKPGAPLGLRDLLESRRRLSQLGLFRRIDIQELEHGPPNRRDVLVTVEESPATTIGYGGGLELTRVLRATGVGGQAEEHIELAPRGFFDIGRRNLGGTNRSVNLSTRVSVRPKDAPNDPTQDGRGFGLSEYRVVGTYREPRVLNTNADLALTAAIEQGVRTSFNFARKGVTADIQRRLTQRIRTNFRYSFNTTRTFDERLKEEEQAAIDRLFPQVRLSTFSGALARDTRDDVVDPSSGTLISAESTIASRALGGQVGFIKTYLQGLWFKQLPKTRRVIFATRASAGLADGFPREADPANPAAQTIEDLPASERFYAGGDTTIRGFALDTVGAPNTISPRGFPLGGNAVLILNGELRVPVWKDIGAALFVDGGNVFSRVTDFDFSELRGSLGLGVRYRSPIGPIRLDMGFKMDRRQIGGQLEPRSVVHFSIGQAF